MQEEGAIKKERILDKYSGIITAEDIQKDSKLRKFVIGKIKKEYNDSDLLMKKKVKLFENWYEKYTNPGIFETNYIKSHVLHQHLKMFMATFFESEMGIDVKGRKIGTDDRAYKIKKLAEFQTEVMEKATKDLQLLWNVGFYGANIEVKNGHDVDKQCLDYINVPPLYWKPDSNGNVIDNNFQYHYFDLISNIEELESQNKSYGDVYFNLDRIVADLDDRDGAKSKKAIRLLSDNEYYTAKFRLLLAYITINGRKYRVEMTNTRDNIVRFEALEAITPAEKKNPRLIPFPVNVTNVFALQDDPCGIGYAELVLDYQNAKNRLLNLAIIKEQENAGFQQVLVDVNKITNLNLLKQKSDKGRTFIPADGDGQPLSNAVAPIASDRVDGNTIQLADKVDFEATMETGMTAQQRGVSGTGNETLGELEMSQINSNVNFGLDSKVLGICQGRFWKNLRYRDIIAHMSDANDLLFSIGSELDNTKIKLTKRDLIGLEDVSIKIVNNKQQKGKDKSQLSYMQANFPLIMQDQGITEIGKLLYKRQKDMKAGFSKEFVETIYKLTEDEIRAKRYVDMINNDIKPVALFQAGMDYETYRIYISGCKDNDLKKKIMNQLSKEITRQKANEQQAMQVQGQAQGADQGTEDMSNIANSMGSQMGSNFIQDTGSKVPSREDI